jgi:hypothetical protein
MDSTTIVWVVVVLLAPALAVSTVPSATVAIPHDEAESLTGGIVYRGDLVPALRGAYVFGDFVTTTVWYRRPGETPVEQRQQLGLGRFAGPTSFGLTRRGELLAVKYDGTLWRLRG